MRRRSTTSARFYAFETPALYPPEHGTLALDQGAPGLRVQAFHRPDWRPARHYLGLLRPGQRLDRVYDTVGEAAPEFGEGDNDQHATVSGLHPVDQPEVQDREVDAWPPWSIQRTGACLELAVCKNWMPSIMTERPTI